MAAKTGKTKVIDADKLCVDGNFADFMKSLRDEVQSLVDRNKVEVLNDDDLPVTIELSGGPKVTYGIAPEPVETYVLKATIKFKHSPGFDIYKEEFERLRGHKVGLENLVKVRLMDCLFFIENNREAGLQVLKRFVPDWKMPDCYAY